MPFAELPDARLHYEIIGTGPPLLLVSGLGGAASYWQPNLAALSAHHQVILHDHRGTGQSTKSEREYSVELLADDLLRLMDIIGLPRAALIGHSTGGAIGQVLAARAPERIERLMLYGSWAVLCAQMRHCMDIRRELLLLGGVAAYHRASPVFLYPPRYMCEHSEQIDAEIQVSQNFSANKAVLAARLEAVTGFDGRRYLPEITTPTTILVAQDDILTPPLASEFLAANIPHARLQILDYGAHAVSRSDPDIFNDISLEFLSEKRSLF